jgi:hypothetical protein
MNYIAKFDWEKRFNRLKSKYKIGIIWLPEVASEFAAELISFINDYKCWDIVHREQWQICQDPVSGLFSVRDKNTKMELYLDFYERLNFGNLPDDRKNKHTD